MFATSARIRPCAARSGPSSPSRVNVSSFWSCLTVTLGCFRTSRLPLGPFAVTPVGVILTSTPLGISTFFRPIRDMGSPDLAQDFTAHAALARLAVGHHALRRRQDRDAEAVADLRHLLGRDVLPLAGTRHPAHAGDRAGVAAVVAKRDLDRALGVRRLVGGNAIDKAFVAQDLGDPELDVGTRALDLGLAAADSITDPGQEISNRIGHRHVVSPASFTNST